MKTVTKITYAAFALFAFACFALLPRARAACQDACLTNYNTAQGDNALINLTTGRLNTAFGTEALLSMTTAFGNTAFGADALRSDTDGYSNTAVGQYAQFFNTTGIANTAVGIGALQQNSTGHQNTAIGATALQDNTGSNNTAAGYQALFFSTTGSNNTAVGSNAMGGDPDIQMTGSNNTATGAAALIGNTSGLNNTATGYGALGSNGTGNYNTADGQGALSANRNGNNNTAFGQSALAGNTTGSNNIAIGSNAGINLTTGSNNIDVFHRGVAGEANTIRIGRQGTQTATFVAGVSGATVPTGVAVLVDATGHLGTTTSSARFKEEIKPMGKASEAILALRPVTFHYKKELDPEGTPQFGLVAEEVAKVNPGLVARDEQGKPYTVHYEAVNAMLLNEFLKAHRKMDQQEATIVRQQKQIDALTGGLQRVSAELELNKPAPKTALNNQ